MPPKKSWSCQNAQTIYNNAQHLGYPIFFFTVMTWQPAILWIWWTKTIFLDKKIVEKQLYYTRGWCKHKSRNTIPQKMWFYDWSETVHLINASLARDLASQLQLSQIVSAWIISRFLVKQWAGKRGKGQQSLKRCLWCRHSMTPDSDIMLWLVKSPNVDRFVVLLTVLDSFKITLLQFRKRFF